MTKCKNYTNPKSMSDLKDGLKMKLFRAKIYLTPDSYCSSVISTSSSA